MNPKFTNSARYKCLEFLKKHSVDLYLCYCGMEECDPGHHYGPTSRSEYLIHYILSGKGIFQADGKTYQLRENNAFIICPDEVTYYQADIVETFLVMHGSKESILRLVRLGQYLCCFIQIFPCPGLIGIIQAGFVKHGLVVPQSNRIKILWHAVMLIVKVVKGNKTFGIIIQVDLSLESIKLSKVIIISLEAYL